MIHSLCAADRRRFALVRPREGACEETGSPTLLSSQAGRTYLLHHFPALRTGLLSLGPSGTDSLGGYSTVLC